MWHTAPVDIQARIRGRDWCTGTQLDRHHNVVTQLTLRQTRHVSLSLDGGELSKWRRLRPNRGCANAARMFLQMQARGSNSHRSDRTRYLPSDDVRSVAIPIPQEITDVHGHSQSLWPLDDDRCYPFHQRLTHLIQAHALDHLRTRTARPLWPSGFLDLCCILQYNAADISSSGHARKLEGLCRLHRALMEPTSGSAWSANAGTSLHAGRSRHPHRGLR